MKKLTTRQFRLYDLLVEVAEISPNLWVSKQEIADYLGKEHYTINNNEFAHDLCSTMNNDRIAINNSGEVDKLILVKDNKFKIATYQEAIEMSKDLYNQALKLLNRMSIINSKIIRDGQFKLLSNQLNPIDEKSVAKQYHETFVE